MSEFCVAAVCIALLGHGYVQQAVQLGTRVDDHMTGCHQQAHSSAPQLRLGCSAGEGMPNCMDLHVSGASAPDLYVGHEAG